jgi:hypothetical protein
MPPANANDERACVSYGERRSPDTPSSYRDVPDVVPMCQLRPCDQSKKTNPTQSQATVKNYTHQKHGHAATKRAVIKHSNDITSNRRQDLSEKH